MFELMLRGVHLVKRAPSDVNDWISITEFNANDTDADAQANANKGKYVIETLDDALDASTSTAFPSLVPWNAHRTLILHGVKIEIRTDDIQRVVNGWFAIGGNQTGPKFWAKHVAADHLLRERNARALRLTGHHQPSCASRKAQRDRIWLETPTDTTTTPDGTTRANGRFFVLHGDPKRVVGKTWVMPSIHDLSDKSGMHVNLTGTKIRVEDTPPSESPVIRIRGDDASTVDSAVDVVFAKYRLNTASTFEYGDEMFSRMLIPGVRTRREWKTVYKVRCLDPASQVGLRAPPWTHSDRIAAGGEDAAKAELKRHNMIELLRRSGVNYARVIRATMSDDVAAPRDVQSTFHMLSDYGFDPKFITSIIFRYVRMLADAIMSIANHNTRIIHHADTCEQQ